jgi:multiple sugar transport system permease protein
MDCSRVLPHGQEQRVTPSHSVGQVRQTPASRRAGWTAQQRDLAFALACVAPTVLLVVGLICYPAIYNAWLSLQRRELFATTGVFVGLENYRYLLAHPELWRSLWNGVVFAGGSVSLQTVLGVGLALLLNRRFHGRNLVRGALLFPYLLPSVVAILVVRWMLNDLYGILNAWLIQLGLIAQPIAWLSSPGLTMLSLIGINTWMFYPFVMICVLARLQAIPGELYEAGRVDGAGPVGQFWHITLPQIRSTLAIVVLVRTLWMFNKFDTVWLTTQGGPFGSTQTVPVMAYIRAFQLYELGRGAAIGLLLCLVLMVMFLAYHRWLLRQGEST